MKKFIFYFLLIFPLFAFSAPNPAISLVENIYIRNTCFALENGSIWKGFSSYDLKSWKKGDKVVITDHPEYGFTAINLTRNSHFYVEILKHPETYIVEINNGSFLLSNGVLLERSSYMDIDVGDCIFLCGYSIGDETTHVIVYNITKPWIGGSTRLIE